MTLPCQTYFYQPKETQMNINDLTLGQLKEIAAMMNAKIPQPTQNPTHPFVGKYVIARCYSAGVHSGFVRSVDGDTCILTDSRRLWSWKAKDGIALSGVAQTGVKEGCKIDVPNPEIYLTGICELIPCSDVSKESIRDFKK
jgi:hypothetical protein